MKPDQIKEFLISAYLSLLGIDAGRVRATKERRENMICQFSRGWS
jgi:hypothetical protein